MLYTYLKERMLRYPQQTISDGVNSLTYAALIAYAEEFGKTLTLDKYGLLFDSDLDTAKALLACIYAGKTAVLLSKKYGGLHVERIVQMARLSHVITERGVEQIAAVQEEREDLSDVALIMSTSGTTGRPKGAMITHRNLITNLTDIAGYFDITEKDHILIIRPLYHCAVLTGEFLVSLIKGLKITFLPGKFWPATILSRLKEDHVTVLCGTPTLLYHLAAAQLKRKSTLKVKTIAVSGECMTRAVFKTVRKVFADSSIYNVYGLTEASPRVSYLPPDEFDYYPLSVGKPLPSLQAAVADNELLIAGPSVMKGYYNDPLATQKAIRDGWLHTGDVAVQDDEGRLYIKCRRDNMIIRAGMNIYPQEIENALKEDEAITDVLAYGDRGDTVSEKIHLKVVTSLAIPEVYALCKRKLMSYELPDAIDIVDEIPRNASGKVIRYAADH